MIDLKKQYKTRFGDAVTLFTTTSGFKQPVLGRIHNDYLTTPQQWDADGTYNPDDKSGKNSHDLLEVKPVREGWVNIYQWQGQIRPFKFHETSLESGRAYNTKQDADRDAQPNRIACIKIQFTEGEGL